MNIYFGQCYNNSHKPAGGGSGRARGRAETLVESAYGASQHLNNHAHRNTMKSSSYLSAGLLLSLPSLLLLAGLLRRRLRKNSNWVLKNASKPLFFTIFSVFLGIKLVSILVFAQSGRGIPNVPTAPRRSLRLACTRIGGSMRSVTLAYSQNKAAQGVARGCPLCRFTQYLCIIGKQILCK